MTDRRAIMGLSAGAIGLILGTAAAVWDAVMLAVVAGAIALAVGVALYRLVGTLRNATERIETLSEQVNELEADVEEAERAALEREAQALATKIDQKAVKRGGHGDALTDEETGLFSEGYFMVAADARLSSARRNLRPVAIVLLEVIEGLESELPHHADPQLVATGITETLREADTACRLGDGCFGLLLEDTPENGAIWTVERLRRHMAAASTGLTTWAGIACYPAHAFDTPDLLERAQLALDMAREWRQDRIEVAHAD